MKLVIRRRIAIKLNMVIFVLLILSYCLTSSDSGEAGSSILKYGALSLGIFHSGYEYFSRQRLKHMRKEYNHLFAFVAIVVLYSIMRSILALHFSFRTIQELIFLFSPMLYSYYVVNTWEQEEIDRAIREGLICAFICYILSLRMNFQSIYRALLSSSFGDSYSELESFTYCGLALAFCLYFCYYNRNKIYTILSFLFVVMTFKRLFLIIAVVLLMLSNFKIREKKVSNKWMNILIVALFLTAIVYFFIMQPENVSLFQDGFNIDISKLTMTRSDRMRWLVTSSYSSYGFGSSTEYMYARFYGALEMDASKIIIELGYIPLFAFFITYIKYAKANLYVFIFMILMLINLIVSSGLTGTFAWCIIFITISMISTYPEEK